MPAGLKIFLFGPYMQVCPLWVTIQDRKQSCHMTIQHVYLSESVDFDPEVMTKIKSIARGTALSALGYGAFEILGGITEAGAGDSTSDVEEEERGASKNHSARKTSRNQQQQVSSFNNGG